MFSSLMMVEHLALSIPLKEMLHMLIKEYIRLLDHILLVLMSLVVVDVQRLFDMKWIFQLILIQSF